MRDDADFSNDAGSSDTPGYIFSTWTLSRSPPHFGCRVTVLLPIGGPVGFRFIMIIDSRLNCTR